jgi:predicted glycosyltransferase
MAASLLYYVSGHGYGHARRSAEVIRALRAVAPDVNVYVRTSAPTRIFAGLTAGPVTPGFIDVPVVERDALSIDWPATIGAAADVLRRRRALVAREVEAVRELDPSLVVADVPFLAGDVGAVLGVPCVAVSNFTWDWVFEPHRGDHPDGASVVRGVRSSYGQVSALLQLPFGHDTDLFPQVVPVPLVARRSTLEREEIDRRLGLDGADRRPRVLVALRGGVEPQTLERAVASAPDFHFLRVRPADVGLDFSDLMAASDVVVSKLGYGTIADAIANGARLVWPPRSGFREDEVTEAEAPRYLRMQQMPPDDFHRGAWRDPLERAMSLPHPPERMPLDGAAACAGSIVERLGAGPS